MARDLRIGVAGLGAIGRSHVEMIQRRLRRGVVVGVTDAATEFGTRTAADMGLPFHKNVRELLSTDVDALMVTAADVDHEAYVLAAIEAGKPVFCEKPLAPDAAACRRIIDAEMGFGRRLVQVGFMRRYDPGYRRLKELIAGGRFGSPLMAHCAHRNFGVADTYDTPMAITSTLIHEIDVLRWLIGEEYATVEMAVPKSTRHTRPHLLDPQVMILTSVSGVRMDIECFVNCRVGYDIQCEVCCEEGFLKLPDPPEVSMLATGHRSTPICGDWSERFIEAYRIEIQEWIDSTLAGCVDGPNSWDGLVACVVGDAGQQSRERGKRVPIDLPVCPDFY